MKIDVIIYIILFIAFIFVPLYLGYLSMKKDIDTTNNPFIKKRELLNIIENSINNMSGFQFEIFCEYVFSANGHLVERTSQTKDGGKDLIVNNNTYVELKRYSKENPVTRETVQKLLGACVSDGINHAIFITTSKYTKDAVEYFQNRKNGAVKLEMWYLDDLLEFCLNIDKNKLLMQLGYYATKNEYVRI